MKNNIKTTIKIFSINSLLKRFLFILPIICMISVDFKSSAQNTYAVENDFRSVFISGGYGAIFGATLGAATLPFISKSPINNIRIIAGGASIGFVLGSLFGFYSVGNSYKSSYYEYDENAPDLGDNRSYNDNLKQRSSTSSKNITVGSLLNKSNEKFNFGIPVFWWANKTVALNLLQYNF